MMENTLNNTATSEASNSQTTSSEQTNVDNDTQEKKVNLNIDNDPELNPLGSLLTSLSTSCDRNEFSSILPNSITSSISTFSSTTSPMNKLQTSGTVSKSRTCDSDSEFCIKPENPPNNNKDACTDSHFEKFDRSQILIKSEILDDEESLQEGEGERSNFFMEDEDDESHGSCDFAIGGNVNASRVNRGNSSNGNKSVQNELNKCKGRLDAFGHELKLLCAELEIVTGWIDQHFGIKLINKESLLFKHIYDFEEIEQISAALSLLSQVEKSSQNPKGSTTTPAGRRRGRPGRKSTDATASSPSRSRKPQPSTSTTGQKRGRRKKGVDNTVEMELNPQDFLETIYDEKDNESQNQSRPKRATRRKINYKEEDKDVEISKVVTAKESEDEFDELEPEDFSIDDAADSDFVNEDLEEKKPPRPKRKRNTPRKKKSEDKTENQEDEGDYLEPGVDGDGGESDESQTDGNAETEEGSGKKKKRVRKRYPKKPGVVWNSSLPKQCDECGKVLKGTSTLKLHKMMHADERPHTCEVCGNKFRFRRNLKVHMMALHTGERPLQCSFCGRKFYAPKDLRIHERTHTGEKPYPCSVCPKRFNVKEHLTMHMRVHTGERPYKCTICEKAFSQANSLRIHKKIHTRDKEPTPRKPRKPKNPQHTLQNNNPLQHSLSSITNAGTTGSGNTNNISNPAPTPSPQSITPSLLSSHSNNTTPTPLQQQQQHHSSSLLSAAAILQQLTPHHSNMSSSSNTNSGHSSPMPAHMNSNLSNLMSSDKLPFTSSNTVPQTSSSSFTSINSSSAMNFHQQAHNMHNPQNPFIVPLNSLNENWRMPFSSVGVDHQRFGSPSNSNSSNSRNLGNRSDNFGGNPLNQPGSHLDPRFHSFYSQNQ